MKRGNNVFKLSGNLALGSNDYLNEKSVSSYTNIGKKSQGYPDYGRSYQKQYGKNIYSQQRGSQMEENINSYGRGSKQSIHSRKKIDDNYQMALNKLDDAKQYPSSTRLEQMPSKQNKLPSKPMQSQISSNYPPRRSTIQKDRGYEQNKTYGKDNMKMAFNSQNQRAIYRKNISQQKPNYEREQYFNSPAQDIPVTRKSQTQIKEYDPTTFVQCRAGCGRKFNPDSIAKHQKICKKVFQNKRKEFNVQEKRLVENEQKQLMRKGKLVQKKIQQKKKQQKVPKWKAQSLGFRAILKANRRGGNMTQQQKKLVSQAQDSSMVKCKFCGRSFSEKAAERHIPFCENQQKKNAMKRKK